MSKPRPAVVALALTIASLAPLVAQDAPTFDVVSIKRNSGTALGSNVVQRPDGGFTMLNIPIGTLISRAYPPAVPVDMVGLPDWVIRERYDVSATSSLPRPTQEEQIAMLRAMLADRCRLAAHFERREQPAYDLVVVRSDKQLGPNITPSDVDCVAVAATQRAAADTGRQAPRRWKHS